MINFIGQLKTNKKDHKIIAWLILLNNSTKPLRDFLVENPVPDKRIAILLNPRHNN
jgi:hypothetical protein